MQATLTLVYHPAGASPDASRGVNSASECRDHSPCDGPGLGAVKADPDTRFAHMAFTPTSAFQTNMSPGSDSPESAEAADALSAYRAKRSPDRSPEPVGVVSPVLGRLFVVHKHAARQLH